jgi:hypothetical protein
MGPAAGESGLVELRLTELSQLFDPFDPSPFHEQDLSRRAEAYIVESAKEVHQGIPSELVVHLVKPGPTGDDEVLLRNAVHAHFARRARHLGQSLRQLLKRGVISLGIGLTFLVAFFVLGQAVMRVLGESPWSTLARESLLIGGWVAMWRPLEIFLYDWWPIMGERRLHDRLSRIPVRVVISE